MSYRSFWPILRQYTPSLVSICHGMDMTSGSSFVSIRHGMYYMSYPYPWHVLTKDGHEGAAFRPGEASDYD